MHKYKIVVAFVFLVLLGFAIIHFDDVHAAKSSGKTNQKYGSDTKNLVCGDKLCSEVKTTQKSLEGEIVQQGLAPIPMDSCSTFQLMDDASLMFFNNPIKPGQPLFGQFAIKDKTEATVHLEGHGLSASQTVPLDTNFVGQYNMMIPSDFRGLVIGSIVFDGKQLGCWRAVTTGTMGEFDIGDSHPVAAVVSLTNPQIGFGRPDLCCETQLSSGNSVYLKIQPMSPVPLSISIQKLELAFELSPKDLLGDGDKITIDGIGTVTGTSLEKNYAYFSTTDEDVLNKIKNGGFETTMKIESGSIVATDQIAIVHAKKQDTSQPKPPVPTPIEDRCSLQPREGVNLSNCKITGLDASQKSLRNANLDNLECNDCIFSHTDLTGASVRNAKFVGGQFDNLVLQNTKMDGTVIEQCSIDPSLQLELASVGVLGVGCPQDKNKVCIKEGSDCIVDGNTGKCRQASGGCQCRKVTSSPGSSGTSEIDSELEKTLQDMLNKANSGFALNPTINPNIAINFTPQTIDTPYRSDSQSYESAQPSGTKKIEHDDGSVEYIRGDGLRERFWKNGDWWRINPGGSLDFMIKNNQNRIFIITSDGIKEVSLDFYLGQIAPIGICPTRATGWGDFWQGCNGTIQRNDDLRLPQLEDKSERYGDDSNPSDMSYDILLSSFSVLDSFGNSVESGVSGIYIFRTDVKNVGSLPVSNLTFELYVNGEQVSSITSSLTFNSGQQYPIEISGEIRDTGMHDIALIAKSGNGSVLEMISRSFTIHHAENVEISNAAITISGQNVNSLTRGQTGVLNIEIDSTSMRPAAIYITGYDADGKPILLNMIGGELNDGSNRISATVTIPQFAQVGHTTLDIVPLSAAFEAGGTPISSPYSYSFNVVDQTSKSPLLTNTDISEFSCLTESITVVKGVTASLDCIVKSDYKISDFSCTNAPSGVSCSFENAEQYHAEQIGKTVRLNLSVGMTASDGLFPINIRYAKNNAMQNYPLELTITEKYPMQVAGFDVHVIAPSNADREVITQILEQHEIIFQQTHETVSNLNRLAENEVLLADMIRDDFGDAEEVRNKIKDFVTEKQLRDSFNLFYPAGGVAFSDWEGSRFFSQETLSTCNSINNEYENLVNNINELNEVNFDAMQDIYAIGESAKHQNKILPAKFVAVRSDSVNKLVPTTYSSDLLGNEEAITHLVLRDIDDIKLHFTQLDKKEEPTSNPPENNDEKTKPEDRPKDKVEGGTIDLFGIPFGFYGGFTTTIGDTTLSGRNQFTVFGADLSLSGTTELGPFEEGFKLKATANLWDKDGFNPNPGVLEGEKTGRLNIELSDDVGLYFTAGYKKKIYPDPQDIIEFGAGVSIIMEKGRFDIGVVGGRDLATGDYDCGANFGGFGIGYNY